LQLEKRTDPTRRLRDLRLSIAVLLVAIPLPLGAALATDAPLWAGAVCSVACGVTAAVLLVLRRPVPPRNHTSEEDESGREPGGQSIHGTGTGPPSSESTHACPPWTPWRDHQCTHHSPTAAPVDDQLLGGVSAFQRHTAPLVRDELARLAREGQCPSHLFLTCADSRLVTSMITSSGPGDLFTVRNIGNLVPPPGPDAVCDSVGAAIEYAVEVLRVSSVTVCGHSGCGAMQALLSQAASTPGPPPPGGPATQTPLARWLRHAQPSVARAQRIGRLGRGEVALAERPVTDETERLALVNVMQQLDHLRAHSCVARGQAEGKLRLHGMYFHVGEAQAYVLDQGSGTFSAVRPDRFQAAAAPVTWEEPPSQGGPTAEVLDTV
jgi:carbonic anhydrase